MGNMKCIYQSEDLSRFYVVHLPFYILELSLGIVFSKVWMCCINPYFIFVKGENNFLYWMFNLIENNPLYEHVFAWSLDIYLNGCQRMVSVSTYTQQDNESTLCLYTSTTQK